MSIFNIKINFAITQSKSLKGNQFWKITFQRNQLTDDSALSENVATLLHDFVWCCYEKYIICISVPLFTWLMSREWYDDDVCMSSIYGWKIIEVWQKGILLAFFLRRYICIHISTHFLRLNYYNSSAAAGNALFFDGVNLAQKLSLHFCG